MPRQLRYLGPGQVFEGTVDDKGYKFYSPSAKFDSDGSVVPPAKRGAPLAVNNDHVDHFLTFPHTHWEEVADPAAVVAPPPPIVPQPQIATIKQEAK